jgi:glutamyl-tRNA synthetase
MVRTRFAPSPTGFLHVGGLRTALYSFLFAKKNHGQFILRIEDTDQTRLVPNAMENLISALNWAGIICDEGPGIGGKFGPYIQSERLDLYQKHALELIKKNQAYYCFCSPERLELIRERKIAAKLPPAYDRTCRNLDSQAVQEKLALAEKFVIRMKVPINGEFTFSDIIRGTVTIDYKNIDDQVLLKSDGFPTYHLAVVVDDHFMEISHVIRGEEWLSSTPKHLLLYQYFGWQAPEFAHIPLLLNPDKSKLSKRQGDVAVEDYIRLGYTKEALINFIAFLGWNPGDTREIFTLEELIQDFSLERVGKSGAIFNIEKLRWLNHKWLTRYSEDDLRALVLPFLSQTYPQAQHLAANKLDQLLKLIQKDLVTLKDSANLLQFYFERPNNLNLDRFASFKYLPQIKAIIKNHLPILVQNHDSSNFLPNIKQDIKNQELPLKELFPIMRYALSGTTEGFGIQDLIDCLGTTESNLRFESFLNLE